MTWVLVTVAKSAGSVPRVAGTQMRVFADHIDGTIGGGALEWAAMQHARKMIADGVDNDRQTVPLGPALGQCCGGSVTLDYARDAATDSGAARDIWVYGAGHVGRALITVLAGLPDVRITWVDTDMARFPAQMPDNVHPFAASDPARAATHAPDTAEHLILTYSHTIDLAICHALLARPVRSIGLIGSATKWARFKTRLATLGHAAAAIARIACPIGDPRLGKHPAEIAIGVGVAMIACDSATKDKTA